MDERPEHVPSRPPLRLSFVNVVFPGEIPLLRLQARSMARFLPDALVEEVVNIVNATDEAGAVAEVEALRAEYGPLGPRVRTLSASEVFAAAPGRPGLRHLPKDLLARNPWLYGRRRTGWRGNDGWQMQQALKLGAARVVGSPIYVILDSKNIFVAPLAAGDFVAPSGQPFARFDHGRGPVDWIGGSIRALGLDPALRERRPVLSILTPAVFERQMIGSLLAAVEARHGSVQALFAIPGNKATEFMLISAWCLRDPGGVLGYFTEGLMDPFNLNYRHTEELRLRHVAGAADGKLVTPHRAVMTSLSPELRDALSRLLVDRGLLGGPEEFSAVVDDLRRRNPELPRQ